MKHSVHTEFSTLLLYKILVYSQPCLYLRARNQHDFALQKLEDVAWKYHVMVALPNIGV